MIDPSGALPRRAVPVRQRRFDWVLLVFFAVNLAPADAAGQAA